MSERVFASLRSRKKRLLVCYPYALAYFVLVI